MIHRNDERVNVDLLDRVGNLDLCLVNAARALIDPIAEPLSPVVPRVLHLEDVTRPRRH